MRYLAPIFASIWPFFYINDYGLSMVAIIVINLWVGVALGEYIGAEKS